MGRYSPIIKEDEWFAGEKKLIRFKLEDEAGGPVDPSTWDFEWVVVQAPREELKLISKTDAVGGGITLLGPDDDDFYTVEITIEASDTADMETGEWFHTLWRTNEIAVLAYGEAVLQPAANL